MTNRKTLPKEELKKTKGGTPGGFDILSGGPHVAQDVLNAIKGFFK
ncbi:MULTISPECIES: hypothetical protein [unclassified Enterococcus]|nr:MULTISPECIES: hypothetical protein [unclassified Enterococcus]MDU0320683.1 hypothetical protein [Enterococcus sp. 2STP]MDU0335828.1 hypothetical protein [Enterococcus sp. 2CBP]MDU0350381.1 hypothetical protein [Enterococcus sp. 3MOLP]